METLINDLINQIKKKLDNLGIYYRIFGRIKDKIALKEKIDRKNKEKENYLLQDYLGIRIINYFYDDNEIIIDLLKGLFLLDNCKIDDHDHMTFKPKRCNYVFKLPENNEIKLPLQVDDTFEIQLRTVLSEGWHEIDHDIRYKSSNNWEGNDNLARAFNGVLASLETADFTILKIFEDFSYQCYKEHDWEKMIYNKMRSRVLRGTISPELNILLKKNSDYLKILFKKNRNEILFDLINDFTGFTIPLNINNFIYYCNRKYFSDKSIIDNETNYIKLNYNKMFDTKSK